MAENSKTTRTAGRPAMEGKARRYIVADDVHEWILAHGGGKTATTITLNSPIEYRGEQVSQFQYGAPSGHLRGYCRI